MSADINNINGSIIQENLNAYKESTWGKKVDGEYIIDGYKFKGRQPFKRTKEKLESLLKRGTQNEISGLTYKVLDTRIKGVELEVEIQITESKKAADSRGIAFVKLYGPNKKKENTVTVTKSKDSDIKFVKILALKIIKPLIDNILSLETTENITRNEQLNQRIKCKICDKSFISEPGMKGHMTRMHKEVTGKSLSPSNVDKEILLLEEIESENEEVNIVLNDIKEEKKYSSKCSECEMYFEARIKYGLIQHMLEHKGECKPSGGVRRTCNDCNYEAKNFFFFNLSLTREIYLGL